MDTWCDMGQVLLTEDKVKRTSFGEKYLIFPIGFYVREEKGEKESIQAFFRGASEFCRSKFIEPRIKVHRLDEGYAHVPKRRDFTEDTKEEIWGNQRFWA